MDEAERTAQQVQSLSDELPRPMRVELRRLKNKRRLAELRRASRHFAEACLMATRVGFKTDTEQLFVLTQRVKPALRTLIAADVLHQKYYPEDAREFTYEIDTMLSKIGKLGGYPTVDDARRALNDVVEGMLYATFPDQDFTFYLNRYVTAATNIDV